MTGFASIPLAEDGEQDNNSHLAGVAKILGPRWLQLPTLTIGLLGVQVFWSIEMSYGTIYIYFSCSLDPVNLLYFPIRRCLRALAEK